MERKRKSYLLRKSDFYEQQNSKPQMNGNAVCSCSKSSARSYDLQTQTITFEDDPRMSNHILNNCVPLLRTIGEDNQKVPDNCSPMDQDLEFYPVDDHPSPSTFTAWDAFLAGNQAFFREPPGLIPDPAFSYMDVIPEEDDLEALLESDTDDTGSSVSTVIDRFSRTSTANSSFSERCKGTADQVTFDLQKVLSPFERLEKELDGDDSKDDQDLFRRREVPRGPIVVITNSSSCEDVHSAEEEETSESKTSEKCNERNEDALKFITGSSSENSTNNSNIIILTPPSNGADDGNKNEKPGDISPTCSQTKTTEAKTPPVPARSKIANVFKNTENGRIKSDKNDTQSSPSSSKTKKSYPTPSVPPRMSKHLPARRTRSDPGSSDQPSKIPRPISNIVRSSNTNSAQKSNPKSSRSPKMNPSKKLKFSESPKSSRSATKIAVITESNTPAPNNKLTTENCSGGPAEKKVLEKPIEKCDNGIEIFAVEDVKESLQDEPAVETNNQIDVIHVISNDTIITDAVNDSKLENDCAQILNLFPTNDEFFPVQNSSEERQTNPFRKNETNPFKSTIESNNPFVKSNNPFQENADETPDVQRKGQMSVSLTAPPIPERPSLKSAQRKDSNNEQSSPDTPTISPSPNATETVNCNEQTSVILAENNKSEKLDPIVVSDNILPDEAAEVFGTANVIETIESTLMDMGIVEKKVQAIEPETNVFTNDQKTEESPDIDKNPGPQRPIEDILQALDQLVLSAPREVEISIDWGVRGPVNIREKTVLPSDASGDRREIQEMEGLEENRKRDIETLLKEVDECLRLHKVNEDLSSQQPTEDTQLPASDSVLSETERIPLSPGSPDAPTAGSTTLNLCHHDEESTLNTDALLEHPPPAMLKHQSQNILASDQRVSYSAPYQEVYSKTTEQLDEDSLINKHHSSGCDDSGVFLEDPVASSPETKSRSVADRLQNAIEKLSNESPKMRQYSIHEGLDSDAEKSDDLGLASSSIDSADDLDEDPLPSSLQINSCPPVVSSRQKPPPVPARKSVSKPTDYQQNNRYYTNEITTLEVPNHNKPPLCKSSSSGEDSNFGEGDHCINEINSTVTLNEKSKNIYNQQKTEQSRSNFAMTRSFHEEMLLNHQRDINQDSKANFLARTLSSSSSVKKLDATNGNHAAYIRRNSEQPSNFKWKSEECLRTAAESKWSIPGRRYEKAVSVKDRIAMFSEMEANHNTGKREDLHRYGSENNIKAVTATLENKKSEVSLNEGNKTVSPLKDSKWHSMHSIAKKSVERETPYISTSIKPALSIPSLTSNNLLDNNSSNNYSTLPVKLEVEPPKPIVSSYPETQLTNNKRYNYGLYSLKNLKNTENLLSKKAAGSNLLSIIDSRKQPMQKLKGLVIPDKPYQVNSSNELPTIVSSDTDSIKDSRRPSLPVTSVTVTKAMSLPRNKKLEYAPPQRQTSLAEPPWKNETNNNSYTLPKYSPAFKKRSLELPGSSLSPTPPSSITSPMSPPPSSPSSICSSNASSTLQQNVFQFSLSHSKPVQPLQPEKALMSPPSLPSDVEYEGDNSEDSSHSASPMRNSIRNNKDAKITAQQNPNAIQYSKSNTFTSSARTVSHQPMMVEPIIKSPVPSEYETPKPKAAIYLSKTEILLKKDEPKLEYLSRDLVQDMVSKSEFIPALNNNDQTLLVQDITLNKSNDNGKDVYSEMKNGAGKMPLYHEKKNGDLMHTDDNFSNKIASNNGDIKNDRFSVTQNYLTSEDNAQDIHLGKFRALPVSLKESEAKSSAETRPKKNYSTSAWTNGRPPHSECEESEDDDSHSTLSHRTEDSRHTTTDDCLSDATTDSFEKPRLVPEPSNLQRSNDDNASTEGYLSDASTDVSIRRFTNRPIDLYSTEEYLSDATAESPDPDWISNRGSMDQPIYSRSNKNYARTDSISHTSSQHRTEETSDNVDKNVDPDLRPRRLSQQRTVLKAAVEPSGSVQKFKALAEKWEQRADVTSPPPPQVVALPTKKETKTNVIAAGVITSTSASSTIIKGKGTLPPSLMPRNSEKKSSSSSKPSKEGAFAMRITTEKEASASVDGIVTRKTVSSTSTIIETSNGWSQHQFDEFNRLESTSRRDSVSSGSSSSKTTLKDDEVFDSPPPPLPQEASVFDVAKNETVITSSNNDEANSGQSSQRQSQLTLSTRQDDIFNNEPRNRRGADFSRSNTIPDWPKSNRPAFGIKSTFSVSDIRRSFENGNKEAEKPIPPKKPPMPAARQSVPPVASPPPVPSRKSSSASPTGDDATESNDEWRTAAESARKQIHSEGVSSQFDILTVILYREGEGGGSVGITLAGGADYEVKEITVHKVISGSIADRDGRVLKGDRVMCINGRDLRGVSHGEALHILKAPSPKVVLVLARDKNNPPLQQNGTMERDIKRRPGNNKDSETIMVELLKDATGLGFSIEGGKDSPQGDRPLLIKRLFKGGAADKDGQLEEGDEIISVNDQLVANMTRTEAWNFLKKLPEGPIFLKARKASVVT